MPIYGRGVCVCGLDLSVHLGIQNIVNDQYEYNEVCVLSGVQGKKRDTTAKQLTA